MTEEIIIDGCNVKDCRRRIGKNSYCRYYKRPCADNNYNCIWKKCLRLEQENKELKEKKDKYYQQTLDDEILMNELSLEVDLRKKESDFYLEKLSKYRSALEEIRNLCNKGAGVYTNAKVVGLINEVLND